MITDAYVMYSKFILRVAICSRGQVVRYWFLMYAEQGSLKEAGNSSIYVLKLQGLII